MNNEIQKAQASEVAIQGQVGEAVLLDYLKTLGTNLPENMAKQFLHIAKAFNLNPFKHEIYAIPYKKWNANTRTEELIQKVREADNLRAVHLEQLLALERTPELEQAARTLAAQLDSDRPWRDIGSLHETLEAVRARYAEVRLELIGRAEKDAEARRQRVKLRDGFNRLSPEQVEHVLRPFREALGAPDPHAVHPSLSALRDGPAVQLPKAQTRADQELDRFIEQLDRVRVVTLYTELHGRELSTPAEVDTLLEELRERLVAQLKSGKVRIRLQ